MYFGEEYSLVAGIRRGPTFKPQPHPNVEEQAEKTTTSGPASCVIYKGRCRRHEVEAKKTVNRSKKWGKVKDGWGWVYSCKVEWTCRMKNFGHVAPNFASPVADRDNSVKSNPGSKRGIRKNFLRGESEPGLES